jgi:DsbC/DsbD-like thiol-disulfide interchange protein
MRRRLFFAAPLAIAIPTQSPATEQPWAIRLLKGGFDGKAWWLGFGVKMQPGWKTYWRVPGAGGIAPDIKLTGDNLKSSELLFPVPKATFIELVGTVIGYGDDVVFPMRVTPVDAGQPLAIEVKSFIGVCRDICIPVRHEGNLRFDPGNSDAPDQAEISSWQARVPVEVTQGPVKKIIVDVSNGMPRIQLEVQSPFLFEGLFVEGRPLHYFAGPRVVDSKIYFDVQGAKSVDELKAAPLRITINSKDGPLEQRVTVE